MRLKNLPDMFIGCGNAQPHFHALTRTQDIDIARHEGRLGLHRDRPLSIDENFQALPGEAVLGFQGLVGIAHTADPHTGRRFALDLLGKQLGRVHLDVHKFSPGFFMPAKAAHEARIAIAAGVFAAGIGIDGIGEHLRFRKDAFGLHFFDYHKT